MQARARRSGDRIGLKCSSFPVKESEAAARGKRSLWGFKLIYLMYRSIARPSEAAPL